MHFLGRSRDMVAVLLPALIRLHLTYLWQHRRVLNLRSPQRFTEWVQHRKLCDRDQRLPGLVDKVAVKTVVAAALGPEWVIPTLWQGPVLPTHPPAPLPLVVKARHGCGHVAFVRTQAEWNAARSQTGHWGGMRYGRWLDEWAYAGVPPGLLIEPYLGQEEKLPVDYKLFVFGGRVAFVQVHLDRATAHRWIVMDRNWARASVPTCDPDPACPASLDLLIAGAERLATDYSFLRIDCYEVAGRPLFGEVTVYPGSGLLPVVPASLDRQMGSLWRQADSDQRRN
ncbi:ATP-grasp fold amidoligase family protein [Sphingomonas sp. Leaf198]|uniref:ATP-grasp fold amidoligase family protein n=2 Tax=unclassified Sphingomonas TaxID=196159 RepID=UPI000AC56C14|nr:ATP-grasp fold amidoligase family protein [Sphingomonas sp. Leaf198]